jgi:hypothetical protein
MMKRVFLVATALTAVLAGPALAQTTITTTTTSERVVPSERIVTTTRRPLSLQPQQRTVIRRYVVERQVPRVEMSEPIAVGEAIPAGVELQPAPYEWGPQLTSYSYVYDDDDQVVFVDPQTRRVVDVLE